MEQETLPSVYEGTEPYIFISYSHEDKDKVYPILKKLEQEGFRIWYDKGNSLGDDFGARLQQKIIPASVIISFLSSHSVTSRWCYKELYFAIDVLKSTKPVIPVYLESTDKILSNDTTGTSILLSGKLYIEHQKEEVTYQELKKALEQRFSNTAKTKNTNSENREYEYEEFDYDSLKKSLDQLIQQKRDIEREKAEKQHSGNITSVSVKLEDGIYDGELVKGLRHGKGRMNYSDGTVYDGEWKMDLPDGFGSCFYSTKAHYSGDWSNGEMDGFGIFNWPNGAYYIGYFQHGKSNGSGTHVFSDEDDRDNYDGEWKDDKCQGKGTLTWKNGDVYTGHWLNNEISGQGTLRYADGSIYKGHFEHGKRSGFGTYTFPAEDDRDNYEGEWKNDKRHGTGKMTWKDGHFRKGKWKNDHIIIKGTG